jgi:hypothetical protein
VMSMNRPSEERWIHEMSDFFSSWRLDMFISGSTIRILCRERALECVGSAAEERYDGWWRKRGER